MEVGQTERATIPMAGSSYKRTLAKALEYTIRFLDAASRQNMPVTAFKLNGFVACFALIRIP